jgi:hypothetical protein
MYRLVEECEIAMGWRFHAGDSRLELGIVGDDTKATKDLACESTDVLGPYYNFMDCRGLSSVGASHSANPYNMICAVCNVIFAHRLFKDT